MKRQYISNGWIDFYPQFLTLRESEVLFYHCINHLPWEQGDIKLFGKEFKIPRLESFHSNQGTSYSYSGKTLTAHPMDKQLLKLKNKIEALANHSFNCVLVNYYRDGNDSNGWHADNEKELGLNPVIASVSLGATRRFDLKHQISGENIEFELYNGSLLIMGGELQQFWKHRIPKQKKVKEGRINLTFRLIDMHQRL
jgi:alkylated DNA repair dioxygenase AlkB